MGTCTIFRSHTRGHTVYYVTNMTFSNYLRTKIDECLDSFVLNLFGGMPGRGPGTTCEARGRFFGNSLFDLERIFLFGSLLQGWLASLCFRRIYFHLSLQSWNDDFFFFFSFFIRFVVTERFALRDEFLLLFDSDQAKGAQQLL